MSTLTSQAMDGCGTAVANEGNEDPYLWLEEVLGEKPVAWAKEHSRRTQSTLEQTPGFSSLREGIAKLHYAPDKLITFSIKDEDPKYIYNFWRDKKNEKGVLRKTTLAQLQSGKPEWETVIDIDALGEKEKQSWVFHGLNQLQGRLDKALLNISPGGSDASVYREFNVATKEFVEGGFVIPEGKNDVTWVDQDTLLVGLALKPEHVTNSGYPKQVRLYRRGENLEEAPILFEGEKNDVSIRSFPLTAAGQKTLYIIQRSPSFFEGISYLLDVETKKITQLPFPLTTRILGRFKNLLILKTDKDWQYQDSKYSAGSYLSYDIDSQTLSVVWEPTGDEGAEGVVVTDKAVYVFLYKNVFMRLVRYELQTGKWNRTEVPLPRDGAITKATVFKEGDEVYVNYQNFVTPPGIFRVSEAGRKVEKIVGSPERFDASQIITEQNWAVSKDGTKVPYFVVRDKNLKLDGKNPTLLYGYGGFQVSLPPSYSGILGQNWLTQGGIYVLANIRGGGEFGPKWWEAALREKRQKAYDDFISVAEDLSQRGYTSPRHLGIRGGSNGGLLMGAMTTQRPDLFNAVICQVPLLDMLRYHKLLAGASWMEEYGNPDKEEERKFILKYSPYQNIQPGVKYPNMLVTTSTKDDRVHPGHARKFVARMMELGQPVVYYENTEGGHGGSATLEQAINIDAYMYAYLNKMLR